VCGAILTAGAFLNGGLIRFAPQLSHCRKIRNPRAFEAHAQVQIPSPAPVFRLTFVQ
jgi:hypothetical protein